MEPTESSKTVKDQYGGIYTLETEPMAQGGQGAVYRVRGHDELLVKLIKNADGSDLPNAQKQAIRHRLEIIRTMDLPESVARPLAILDGDLGYVMRMVRDMRPIAGLLNPQSDDPEKFFRDTGGLVRRLDILHDLAMLMARLHAIPVIYSDLSPNNVFVPSNDSANVWLIDTDNLHYSTASQYFVYTPGFAAPEVESGDRPATTLSDAWSFAALAFYLLTLNHPFEGNWAAESTTETRWSQDDWGDPGQDKDKPWVFHSQDRSNALPDDAFAADWHRLIAPRLFELFRRTFEEGFDDPMARPGMSEWVDAIRSARMAAIKCDCGHSYYVFGNKGKKCPYCGKMFPTLLYYEVLALIGDDNATVATGDKPMLKGVARSDERLVIPKWMCKPVADENEVMDMQSEPGGIRLRSKHALTVVAGEDSLRVRPEGTRIADEKLHKGVWIVCPWEGGGGRVLKVRSLQ